MLSLLFNGIEITSILHDRNILSRSDGRRVKYWRIHPIYRWVLDVALILACLNALYEVFRYFGCGIGHSFFADCNAGHPEDSVLDALPCLIIGVE